MIQKKILAVLLVGIFGLWILSPALGAPSTTVTPTTLASASVSLTPSNASSRVALYPPLNVYGNLSATGTDPANFYFDDYSSTAQTTFSGQNNMSYPESFKTTGQAGTYDPRQGVIQDPWSGLRWIRTTTVNPITGYASNYTISGGINVLGTISDGNSHDYYVNNIAGAADWYQIPLSIGAAGVYALFYSGEAGANAITAIPAHMMDPWQQEISMVPVFLPVATSGGSAIQKLFVFVANSSGTYQFFFQSDIHLITFKLTSYGVTGSLGMGDSVSYKEEPNPSANTYYSASNFLVNIYTIPVTATTSYYYNYLVTQGNPLAYICRSNGWGYYSIAPLSSAKPNGQLYSYSAGTMYLVVLNNNYFTWIGTAPNQFPVRQLMGFNFVVNTCPTATYNISTTGVFSVDPLSGFTDITFSISTHSGLMFNYSVVTPGTITPTLSITSSSNGLFFENPAWQPEYLGYTSSMAQAIGTDYLYDLMPGTYHILLGHDYAIDAPESIALTTTNVTGPAVPRFPVGYNGAGGSTQMFDSNLVTETNYYPYGGWQFPGGNQLTPIILPFNVSASLDPRVNITLVRADNPYLGAQQLTFSLRVGLMELSKFDGATPLLLGAFKNIAGNTLGAGIAEVSVLSGTFSVNLLNQTLGDLVLWPYTVTNNSVQWNSSLVFRVTLYDQMGYVKQGITLSNLPKPTLWDIRGNAGTGNTSWVNFWTYNSYNFSDSFLYTNYHAELLYVTAAQKDDWYQIILSTNNTPAAGEGISFYYENPWTGITTTSSHLSDAVLSGAQANYNGSTEWGVALTGFWVYIYSSAASPTPTWVMTFNLNLAEYQVPTLAFPATTVPNILPPWAVPLIIVAAVAGGGVVAAFFGVKYYKKRKFGSY